MTNDNVVVVRNAYQIAERKDLEAWVDVFTPDGGVHGQLGGHQLPWPRAGRCGSQLRHRILEHASQAVSNLRRWQRRRCAAGAAGYARWTAATPFGVLPATGKQMDAPCCDVFELQDGKIKRFDCYPEGSIIFAQLGVLTNLESGLRPLTRVLRRAQRGAGGSDELRLRLAWICSSAAVNGATSSSGSGSKNSFLTSMACPGAARP